MNFIIVDDDPMTIRILEDFSSKFNYLKFKGSYNNLINALNKHEADKIDMIILDVELPEMSGLEYLKNFKHKPLVVIISSTPAYAVDAFEFDATDFILKPLQFPRFMKSMQKVKKMYDLINMTD